MSISNSYIILNFVLNSKFVLNFPEGILSYKLTASYEGDANKLPRIGLRGTAKVYGSEVSVFYYLFRKPITFMRQLIGI